MSMLDEEIAQTRPDPTRPIGFNLVLKDLLLTTGITSETLMQGLEQPLMIS